MLLQVSILRFCRNTFKLSILSNLRKVVQFILYFTRFSQQLCLFLRRQLPRMLCQITLNFYHVSNTILYEAPCPAKQSWVAEVICIRHLHVLGKAVEGSG